MTLRTGLPILAATAALLGCSSPLFNDNCEADRIVAGFDGAIAGDMELEIQREDALAATNLSPNEFRLVYRMLFEGEAPAAGVVWTHGLQTGASDFFAISLATPLVAGQTRQVTSAFQGGGWGPLTPPGAAAVALRIDTIWATAAEGEARVIQARPLVLEVDVGLALSSGDSLVLTGTDSFRYDRGTCPDARE
jgi:hypothetical protein